MSTLPEQLKTVLTSDTNSILAPKLYKKTVLIKKRNKQLQNNHSIDRDIKEVESPQPQQQSAANQNAPKQANHKQQTKQQEQLKQISGKKETENNSSKCLSQPQLSNSVSCQTSQSLIFSAQDFYELPPTEIPPSDPIWLEIIPAELLKDTSVEKLLEDNKDYFYNLLGLYIQERMQNEFNMSKCKLPLKWQSSYFKDFDRKSLEKVASQNLDSRVYDDFKTSQNGPFLETAYKSHFKPYDSLEYHPRFPSKTYQGSSLSMSNLTSYKAAHVDYRSPMKPEVFSGGKGLTTGLLPMDSMTQYRKEFREFKDVERVGSFKNAHSRLYEKEIAIKGIQFKVRGYSSEKNALRMSNSPSPERIEWKLMPRRQHIKGSSRYDFLVTSDFQDYERYDLKQQVKNWRQHVVNKVTQLRERERALDGLRNGDMKG